MQYLIDTIYRYYRYHRYYLWFCDISQQWGFSENFHSKLKMFHSTYLLRNGSPVSVKQQPTSLKPYLIAFFYRYYIPFGTSICMVLGHGRASGTVPPRRKTIYGRIKSLYSDIVTCLTVLLDSLERVKRVNTSIISLRHSPHYMFIFCNSNEQQ